MSLWVSQLILLPEQPIGNTGLVPFAVTKVLTSSLLMWLTWFFIESPAAAGYDSLSLHRLSPSLGCRVMNLALLLLMMMMMMIIRSIVASSRAALCAVCFYVFLCSGRNISRSHLENVVDKPGLVPAATQRKFLSSVVTPKRIPLFLKWQSFKSRVFSSSIYFRIFFLL